MKSLFKSSPDSVSLIAVRSAASFAVVSAAGGVSLLDVSAAAGASCGARAATFSVSVAKETTASDTAGADEAGIMAPTGGASVAVGGVASRCGWTCSIASTGRGASVFWASIGGSGAVRQDELEANSSCAARNRAAAPRPKMRTETDNAIAANRKRIPGSISGYDSAFASFACDGPGAKT